jgi:hypothetical protein
MEAYRKKFWILLDSALQLKAIATSFDLLAGTSNNAGTSSWLDSTFYGTMLLTVFILFFGTRSHYLLSY